MSKHFAKYRKAYVAALFAGLEAAQHTLPMNTTVRAYVTVALAALGALGVVAVPNKTEASNPLSR